MADSLSINPAYVISLCALGLSVWQARCSARAQLISQRNLELQETSAQLKVMDTQYGQHLIAHQAALEQLKIDVAILRTHMQAVEESLKKL